MPDYHIYGELHCQTKFICGRTCNCLTVCQMKNTRMENKREVTGEIRIKHLVECPNCGKTMDDMWDEKWFNNTMGGDFPIDEGYKQTFDAKCPGCNQDFLINGFVY